MKRTAARMTGLLQNAVSHRPSRDRKAMQMSTLHLGLALTIRIVLVLLFLPFSALDKVLDFRGAVAQARGGAE